jgi:hypothetical protein
MLQGCFQLQGSFNPGLTEQKEAQLQPTHKTITRPALQVTCFQGLGKHGLPAFAGGCILRAAMILKCSEAPRYLWQMCVPACDRL